MLRGTVRAKERKRKSREVGEVAVLLLTGLTAAGSRAYISSRGSCRLEGTSRGKVITACPVPAHSPTHCAEPTPAPAPAPEPDPDGRASTLLDRFPFFLVLLCLLSSPLSLLSLSLSSSLSLLSSSTPTFLSSSHLILILITSSSSSSPLSSLLYNASRQYIHVPI